MSPTALEQRLRDLPAHGTLVKDRPNRQVWRFDLDGRGYYLKFYPRPGTAAKRLVRGNPAIREFTRLQMLQRAGVPSPRAVSVLSGYVLAGRAGDAVISEAIEPGEPLDAYLNGFLLAGEEAPDHRALVLMLVAVVRKLGLAKLGHADLHLGNFLRSDGKLFLLDAYAVRPGGLRMRDVALLGHSVQRFATTADLLRGWREFGQPGPLPRIDRVRRRQWRKALDAAAGGNRYFARVRLPGGWSGVVARHAKFPRRWSAFSRLDLTQDDAARLASDVLERLRADTFEVIKQSRSGDVVAGEALAAGVPLDVVIKRPRRKKWYRYLNEIGRGGRARRAWFRAWSLVARDVPTAWPMLLLERRAGGYVVEQILACERVPGTLLADFDFDGLDSRAREDLFRRLGRSLRRMEQLGLHQYDAKTSNWMIRTDERLGPVPIVLDVDGIRKILPAGWPLQRLLRSLRDHPQYAPGDSLHLCLGYRPTAAVHREGDDAADVDELAHGGPDGGTPRV